MWPFTVGNIYSSYSSYINGLNRNLNITGQTNITSLKVERLMLRGRGYRLSFFTKMNVWQINNYLEQALLTVSSRNSTTFETGISGMYVFLGNKSLYFNTSWVTGTNLFNATTTPNIGSVPNNQFNKIKGNITLNGEAFAEVKDKDVFRIEIRLNNTNKMKRLFREFNLLTDQETADQITFKRFFSLEIYKKVCFFYYEKILKNIVSPKKDDLIDMIIEMFKNKNNLKTGKFFSNIGVACSIAVFGRDVIREKYRKKSTEVERYLSTLKIDYRQKYYCLGQVYNALDKFLN